ncbi:threonine--tRNA ligase, partial [archaeon]|nr:threonine--tRNA ligase [archaeon]
MKLLFIHSDYIEYEAKEKLRFAEDIKEKKHRIEECLVVFTAVEKDDEKNPDDVVKNAVREIKDVSGKVKTKRIVIYPYAHLSSSLASPENAKKILAKMEESLKDYDVVRAPFGWYKSFKISCKGHPLSELSRIV